jgi:hypothetical protein
MKNSLVLGAPVVNALCEKLGYTRPHIILIMRKNKRALGARKKGHRWMLPAASVALLHKLVKETSGRRYKLGETGPH